MTATTSAANTTVNYEVISSTNDNANVDYANNGATRDFFCTTDAVAPFTCTVSYQDLSTADTTDSIRGWIDEPPGDNVFSGGETTETVTKAWSASTADPTQANLNCQPETDVNPQGPAPGSNHQIFCLLTDQNNNPFGTAQDLDSENEAAAVNDPDNNATFTDPDNGCNTAANPNGLAFDGTLDGTGPGECTITYVSENQAGTAPITVWWNQDNNSAAFDGDPGEVLGDAENNNATDEVSKTWQARVATFLDITPESANNPNGTTHTLTATFTDQFGDPIDLSEGQLVDFEIISGPNSNLTPNFRDFECPSNSPTTGGTCTATYQDNAAFDAGNAIDVICAWLSTDGDDDVYNPATTPDDGGDCDAEVPGETQAGLDPNGQTIAGNEGNDNTDVVTKTWQVSGATQLNAEPETDTNPAANGSTHTIQVSALSPSNQPQTSSAIRADIISGPDASGVAGQAEINCTADNTPPPGSTVVFNAPEQQTHECVLTNNGTPGTDVVRVFIDADNDNTLDANETFDEVTKIWSGAPFALVLTPDNDSATAGVCNEFTATVTDAGGRPVVGANIDVLQSLTGAGNDPTENRELYYCDPTAGGTAQTGANPATQQTNGNLAPGAVGAGAGTRFGDVQGNQQVSGAPGNNTAVHAEVGPTSTTGQVTFGIGIRCGGTNADVSCITTNATVSVRAWVDNGGDNDTFDAGEPTDQPSTKTWTPGGTGSVTTLNAEPETATNPVNTQHQVTVTITGAGGPIQNVTPASVIAANGAGRPANDVANANSGASPNAGLGPYACTASNAQGISTCTFTDPGGTPAGTDTIIFFVNQAGGGTPGPDANEPQDAVQKTWVPGPTNLDLDLQCGGTGTLDDQDVGERGADNDATPDCLNPLTDTDEIFTAIVTNPAQNNNGVQGVRVDFTFGARTSGSANSTDDATLNATGGGSIGTTGALLTFCTTDVTGRCSVTLTNPTPVSGDTIAVNSTISGGTGPNINDNATKRWQTGSVQGGTITVTPRAATNQIGTQHTVTATVRNQFGQPVQGADVDWAILPGSANANITPEVDDVTDASGNATFTYTSSVVGQDQIRACTETGGSENDVCDGGEPSAIANKTWQTGPVSTAAVNLDMQSRVQNVGPIPPAGSDAAGDDCEVTTLNNVAREKSASNQINPNVASGPGGETNFHEICAGAFQTSNNAPTAGASITFTISGVGRIYAANPNNSDRCSTGAVPAAGTTLTVTADNNGIARACLYSQTVGRTSVTATSGSQSDTGTKDWTVNPATARFIQLCHGDVAGTTCETASQTNPPNDEHQMTARVTDRQGNPVANVPVQFRETGPGIFTPQGGSTATVLTDANGLASILLTSDVEGTSTIVAEIDAGPGGVGTFRTAGATGDECEAPAGTNNSPAAGNCISQTLTKVWEEDVVVDPQCDDGLDNDSDGLTDFGEDPGCVDDNDNSELPVNTPPEQTRDSHDRSISIRFNDGTGARNNGLVVFGRLRVTDGFSDCFAQQPVNIQRRINGRWVTKKTTNTNRRGRYAVEIFDQASRYRAVAVRTEILDEDLNVLNICKKAVKAKRHRHRR